MDDGWLHAGSAAPDGGSYVAVVRRQGFWVRFLDAVAADPSAAVEVDVLVACSGGPIQATADSAFDYAPEKRDAFAAALRAAEPDLAEAGEGTRYAVMAHYGFEGLDEPLPPTWGGIVDEGSARAHCALVRWASRCIIGEIDRTVGDGGRTAARSCEGVHVLGTSKCPAVNYADAARVAASIAQG